jgi:hypothetical protein
MTEPKVFVSHSSLDTKFASKLVEDLNAAGAKAWLDSNELGAGDFQERISKALADCEWFLVVLTPNALASPWVRQEVNAANRLKHQHQIHDLIFIKATEVKYSELPALWGVYNVFDATTDYEGACDHAFKALGLISPMNELASPPGTLGTLNEAPSQLAVSSGEISPATPMLAPSVPRIASTLLPPTAFPDRLKDHQQVGLKEYQLFIARKDIVRRAQQNRGAVDGVELGNALLDLMGIGNPYPELPAGFPAGSVWRGLLPRIPLSLPTDRATIFIHNDDGLPDYQSFLDQRAEDGCVIVIDLVDRSDPPVFTALAPVWVRANDVDAMLRANQTSLGQLVRRLIARQVNAGLYPYKTFGVSPLFFGRAKELRRLSDDQNHGGIIIGAHRSGKTMLLHKLQGELVQRQRIVVGPFSFAGTLVYQEFFERVQTQFERIQRDQNRQLLRGTEVGLALENFDSTIRGIRSKVGRASFLMDEVDSLLEVDEPQGWRLTKIMRTLAMEGQADFYLAGHSRLRSAIARQESPLRNFADEVTLIGLDEEAAVRLIQEPLEQLGYIVTADQAHRIYRGTAGVSWLIQYLCIALLYQGKDQIDDAVIQRVERDGPYLSAVWEHFQYGLDPISSILMLRCAAQPQTGRAEFMQYFADHALGVSRSNLDEHVDFLLNFGVLQEDPPGYFSVTSLYLQYAIEARDPAGLLTDYLDQARNNADSG